MSGSENEAVYVTADAPERLNVRPAPMPQVGPSQALIRVQAGLLSLGEVKRA